MVRFLINVLIIIIIMFILSNLFIKAHHDVTPTEAKNMIDSGENLIVLDVCEKSEFMSGRGHILRALNYPWNSGILRKKYKEIPKDVSILIVCRLGRRSNKAANFLSLKGYLYIYDMLGGMTAWQWETTCNSNEHNNL